MQTAESGSERERNKNSSTHFFFVLCRNKKKQIQRLKRFEYENNFCLSVSTRRGVVPGVCVCVCESWLHSGCQSHIILNHRISSFCFKVSSTFFRVDNKFIMEKNESSRCVERAIGN